MHANTQTIAATASAPAGLILIESPRALSPDEFRAIRAVGFAWQADARAFVAPWTVEAFDAAARLAGRVDVKNAETVPTSGEENHAQAFSPMIHAMLEQLDAAGEEEAPAAQASGESETIAAPHDFPRPGCAERFTSSEASKTPTPSGEAKPAAAEFAKLSDFVGRSQLAAIRDAMHGEEGAHFVDLIMGLAQRIAAMPQTYQQDGMGDAAVISLHYFNAGSDWYITEKDADGGTAQAFGYAVLNGMEDCAELGYISIAELVAHGVELDLYWQPRTLGEVKAERAGGDGGPDGPGAGMDSGEAGEVQASGEQSERTKSGEDTPPPPATPATAPKIQTVERTGRDGVARQYLAHTPKGCITLHPLTYGSIGVAEARAAKLRAAGIAAQVRGSHIEIDPSGEVPAVPACATLIPGRWIPGGAENAERVAFDAALGAEVWIIASTSRPGHSAVIAYSGKCVKHSAYYTMRDRAQALQWAGEYMSEQQARAKRKADQRAEQTAKRAAGHKLQAGDVLRCSWGYDQTNIDYYEVTRLIGRRMVEIRKIGAESVSDGYMTGDCVPRPGHYVGEPMRKTVSDYDGQSVRIASYASAHKIEPREVSGVKLYPVDHWTAYA